MIFASFDDACRLILKHFSVGFACEILQVEFAKKIVHFKVLSQVQAVRSALTSQHRFEDS